MNDGNRIVLQSFKARLVVGGEPVSDLAFDAIDRVLLARNGMATDPFYLVMAAEEIWVVPKATPGMSRLLAETGRKLEAAGRLLKAQIGEIPKSWRRRVLGFATPSPVPRLACHPRADCPPIQETGTVRLRDMPDRPLDD